MPLLAKLVPLRGKAVFLPAAASKASKRLSALADKGSTLSAKADIPLGMTPASTLRLPTVGTQGEIPLRGKRDGAR